MRRARKDEPIITLDGKQRTLSDDDLVIADAEKPIGLAGVMGGQTSEVSDATTRILIDHRPQPRPRRAQKATPPNSSCVR